MPAFIGARRAALLGAAGSLLNLSPSAFASSGATIPIYAGATYPSVFHDDTTEKTWQFYQVMLRHGGRGTQVVTYDHAAAAVGDNPWSPRYTLPTAGHIANDDHGVPAGCLDHQSYAHCFDGAHNGNMRHRVTAVANDPVGWVDRPEIVGEYTYPHPLPHEDDIYLLMRKRIAASNKMTGVLHVLRTLVDGVETSIDSEVTWVDFGGAGAGSRFYMGYTVKRDGKFWIFANWADFNDQKRQNHYLYIFDPADGDPANFTVSNLDGSVTVDAASFPIDLTTSNTSFRIVTQSGDVITRFGAPAWTSNGDLHYCWFQGENPGSDFPIFHKYWNGTAWSTPEQIGDGPDWQTVLALAAHEDDSLELIATTDEEAAWTLGGDISRAIRSPEGTWTGLTRIHEPDAGKALSQPVAVLNGHPGFRFAWFERAVNDQDANAGGLRGFAWGDDGFLPRTDGIPLSDQDLEPVLEALVSTVLTVDQMAAYSHFFIALRNTTVLATLPYILFGGAPTLELSLINLKNPAQVATFNGTFASLVGWTVDGISQELDTGVNPSTAGIGGQDSFSLVFGCLTQAATSGAPIGASDGSHLTFVTPRNPSNNTTYRINQNTTETVSGTNSDGRGLYQGNRGGPASISMYKAGSSIDTGSVASTGLPNRTIRMGQVVAATFVAVSGDFIVIAPNITTGASALNGAYTRLKADLAA